MGEPAYLIRYGVMGYVGRFRVARRHRSAQARPVRRDPDRSGGRAGRGADPPGRGRRLQGRRAQRVLRAAGPDDLDRSRHAEASRPDRFATCRRILEEEGWPWDLIDVEPLLDDGVTVLQYLGPHHLDAAEIRARFRMAFGLDVVLEPVGADEEEAAEPVGGGCGSGGCGSGGGCGDGGCSSKAEPEAGAAASGSGCGSSPHGGCPSCGLSGLAAAPDGRPAVRPDRGAAVSQKGEPSP